MQEPFIKHGHFRFLNKAAQWGSGRSMLVLSRRGWAVKSDHDARVPRRKRLGALALLVALMASGASAAAANPLTDCFERIAVAVRHVPHPHAAARPHAVHKVHHVRPRARRPHRVKVTVPTAAYAHRTHYILRPRACGTHEAMMTPLPGAVGPEAPELLLSALAGPLPPPGVDVADTSPALIGPSPPSLGLPSTPEAFLPSFPPSGVPPTGGFVVPGAPGGPGPPPVGPPPPGQPPIAPPGQPPVTPPDQPPITPPGQPPVLPPDQPPVVPPLTPGGPGVPGIPEPATWAMLIVGFFGIGAVLRQRRTSSALGRET
jgi:hypothetical protein